MSAVHTAGPWFTARPHGTIYVEAKISGSTVQEVAACGPTEAPMQQEANARLIAAAPCLLAALIDCRRALELANCAGELAVVDAAVAKAVQP